MYFDEFGQQIPADVKGKCQADCELCLSVCPFNDDSVDEAVIGQEVFADVPGIHHCPETGYWLGSFVGYSREDGHRENGASGGLATWTLEHLLTRGMVDHVVCVSPTEEPNRLFKFAICDTPQDVRACSSSCYYPVHLGEIVRHILAHEGRYAIVALPCTARALRLGMRKLPKLKDRIVFILGLVCGQMKSRAFWEYICSLAGGNAKAIQKIRFRLKDSNRRSSDYGARFVSVNEADGAERDSVIFNSQGMMKAWKERYFTPNACNFCDDVFAETADASFMDAWLPEYVKDYRGHSIVITRSEALNNLLQDCCGEMDTVAPIAIKDAIRSQRSALHVKRSYPAIWTRAAEKAGLGTRAVRSDLTMSCRADQRVEARILWRIGHKSRSAWVRCGKDVGRFRRYLGGLQQYLCVLRFVRTGLRAGPVIINRLMNILKRKK